ncbi:uncharacterized protein LOC127871890 isoform X2 [Dreissena polymorpha]|uniref:uncharacterized protein LOC127871890 isoform X2 n=1 Tax=Dreissena polymorpha TaxID=45954 RepID=UPI002264FA45|nr:uncharacterized protein LOC127871890 isoform X2 [Dreissena polymorpha]
MNLLDKSLAECQRGEIGQRNVMLQFDFKWRMNETKYIQCYKSDIIIGRCNGITILDCSVELKHVGVYYISSNTDLSSVSLLIATFNVSYSGDYSCSKVDNQDEKKMCIIEKVATSGPEATKAPASGSEATAQASGSEATDFGDWKIVGIVFVNIMSSAFGGFRHERLFQCIII